MIVTLYIITVMIFAIIEQFLSLCPQDIKQKTYPTCAAVCLTRALTSRRRAQLGFKNRSHSSDGFAQRHRPVDLITTNYGFFTPSKPTAVNFGVIVSCSETCLLCGTVFVLQILF